MKKIIALILALTLVFSFAACAAKADDAKTEQTTKDTAQETTTQETEQTEQAEQVEQTEQPQEEETPELSGSLVICSSATDNDLAAIQEGFNSIYPDVEIEFVTCSAGEGIARVQAEAGNPTIDVFYSGLNQADGDKYADCFEQYVSTHDAEVPEQYQSNNGFYNYDHLSSVVFCVNTELEAELGLDIKGYADLLDPKLEGKIIFSDPTSSSAAWNNMSNIFAVYGNDSDEAWDVIEGLLANGMVVGSSSSNCFKDVQAGEYVVGLTYEDGASTLLKSGAENIKMVYPAEGSSAFAFAAAIVKDAPHMDAAKAMIEYLQSAEGQSFRANYVGTVRFTNENVVVENSYLPDSSEINWVTRDIDWLIENKTAMLEKWTALYNQYNG